MNTRRDLPILGGKISYILKVWLWLSIDRYLLNVQLEMLVFLLNISVKDCQIYVYAIKVQTGFEKGVVLILFHRLWYGTFDILSERTSQSINYLKLGIKNLLHA